MSDVEDDSALPLRREPKVLCHAPALNPEPSNFLPEILLAHGETAFVRIEQLGQDLVGPVLPHICRRICLSKSSMHNLYLCSIFKNTHADLYALLCPARMHANFTFPAFDVAPVQMHSTAPNKLGWPRQLHGAHGPSWLTERP